MNELLPFFLSSLLLFLSFPPLNLGFLAWFSFFPFFFGIKKVSLNKAFLYSFFSGCIFYSLHLWWLTNVTYLGTVLLIFYLSLYFGLFGFLTKKMDFSFLLPSIWTILEWIRAYLFTGFPWSPLANTQFLYPYFLRILPYTGLYGLSYIIILFNLSIFLFIFKRKVFYLGVNLISISLFSFFPSYPIGKGNLKIGIVEGKFRKNTHTENAFLYYMKNTLKLKNVDMVIWPEAAIPSAINKDKKITYEMRNLSSHIQTSILSGGFFEEKRKIYNSAYLIDKNGIRKIYSKIKLVPFGEYLPLKKFFPFFKKIAKGVSNFSPGKNFSTFDIKGHKFIVLICFENLFPEHIRKFPQYSFIVVITSDSLFKSKVANWEHFSHSVMRAVEFSKPLIQVSNMGISGVVNSSGKIISIINGRGKVIIHPNNTKTFYARFGDWFPFLHLFLLLLAFIENIFMKRKKTIK